MDTAAVIRRATRHKLAAYLVVFKVARYHGLITSTVIPTRAEIDAAFDPRVCDLALAHHERRTKNMKTDTDRAIERHFKSVYGEALPQARRTAWAQTNGGNNV